MKKIILFGLILFFVTIPTFAQPQKLPYFNFPDPEERMHSSEQLIKHGLVIIASAPILHNKEAQEKWSKFLADTKKNHPASLILIQNMTEALFKGIASREMKKKWQSGDLPILLKDSTGKMSNVLGVKKHETKIFVYDKNGDFVYSYDGAPTYEAAKKIWEKI